MATVEDRGKDFPGKRWKVRWWISPTQQRSKSFARKADADRFRSQVEVETAAGEVVDPSRGRVTVGQLADEFLNAMRPPIVTESTWSRYEVSIRRQVLPAFGGLPVASVRHSAVKAWVADLSREGLSASTVIQAYQRLAQIFDLAVADDRIRKNPARGVATPSRPAHPRKRYLTDEQLIRLAFSSQAPELILTLGYCGLRIGEAIGLQIRDLDFRRGRMFIRDSYTPVGGRMVRGDTKTHQSREVPMPSPLAEMLRRHTEGRSGLVFTAPNGGLVQYGNFRSRVFAPAAHSAGLLPLTPHDLRHTAASIAVDSGANIMAVAIMLGHRDPSITLRIYADLFPEHFEELTKRLSDRMARSLVSPACPEPTSLQTWRNPQAV